MVKNITLEHMNLIDYSLRFNSYPIIEARKKLKEIQQLQNKDFNLYVKNQKNEIVNYHIKNNQFYKNLVNNKNWNWNSLPILEKKDLQIPLKERLSKNYTLKNIFKNKTSGSTGNPFYFAKDKFSHALTWAVITNRFNWHNLYGKKQARFYGLPSSGLVKRKEQLKDLFSNRLRFNVFDLSNEALKRWIDKFASTKFVYLNGYTTVLVVFAKYLVSEKIILKEICPTLTACVVTSEMLFDTDKLLLQKAFGVPVINEYGASELDLIAFEDTNNNWILNTETLFVEVLDDNNNTLEDGEIGNIVITSLYNKANPFIRYKIGDKGAIKKINSNQYILQKLEGRSEDLVKLPSGKIAPGLTFYYITKSIMEDSGEIQEIKIIQTTLDSFKIEYISKKELEKYQKEKIKNALLDYLEPNLKISFLRFEHLERSKSGKLKQFTSLIK
jgi:phenylacetate-CoA ligase